MTPIDITPTLTQCEIATSLITVVRHALYDEDYDRAMDEATELIKTGMAMRDQIFRMTHTSGDVRART
jgi:hypothetical protein